MVHAPSCTPVVDRKGVQWGMDGEKCLCCGRCHSGVSMGRGGLSSVVLSLQNRHEIIIWTHHLWTAHMVSPRSAAVSLSALDIILINTIRRSLKDGLAPPTHPHPK